MRGRRSCAQLFGECNSEPRCRVHRHGDRNKLGGGEAGNKIPRLLDGKVDAVHVMARLPKNRLRLRQQRLRPPCPPRPRPLLPAA